MGPGFGKPLEFAQHNHAVFDVMDDTRFEPIQTDEA
jgi:hypothetical protein